MLPERRGCGGHIVLSEPDLPNALNLHPSVSRQLFLAIQRASGADIHARLKELEESDYMPRADIRELQWRRLRDLVEHAYKNIPFYRRYWDQHGVILSQVQNFDDFKSLPILTKKHVRENYNDLLSPIHSGDALHHGKTSGSSGTPMRFLRTQDSKARFWAAQYRGYGRFGIRPGDRQGRFYGMPFEQAQSRKERLKDFVMNRKRLMGVFDLADHRLQDFAAQLNRFRPVYFNGYSTWLGRFAEFVANQPSIMYDWIPLKGAVATSDILTNYHRGLIEKTFHCPVIDEYGGAEIGLIAISCPDHGFHTVPENTYLEQLVSENSKASGTSGVSYGEVIVTDLHSHAMPFIRYQLGDLLEQLKDPTVECTCGRPSELIGSVLGRTTHYIVTPAGELRSGWIFDYMLKLSDEDSWVNAGCARQTSVDKIVVYLEATDNVPQKFVDFVNSMAAEHISPDIAIVIEQVDELPRSATGKVRTFVSDLDIDREIERIRGGKVSSE